MSEHTTNDNGGLTGGKLTTGFDPSDKAFYHGGDLTGLTQKLDYIKGMGTTAIWLRSDCCVAFATS